VNGTCDIVTTRTRARLHWDNPVAKVPLPHRGIASREISELNSQRRGTSCWSSHKVSVYFAGRNHHDVILLRLSISASILVACRQGDRIGARLKIGVNGTCDIVTTRTRARLHWDHTITKVPLPHRGIASRKISELNGQRRRTSGWSTHKISVYFAGRNHHDVILLRLCICASILVTCRQGDRIGARLKIGVNGACDIVTTRTRARLHWDHTITKVPLPHRGIASRKISELNGQRRRTSGWSTHKISVDRFTGTDRNIFLFYLRPGSTQLIRSSQTDGIGTGLRVGMGRICHHIS